jgi:predicted amidophosphoribosyltransferase
MDQILATFSKVSHALTDLLAPSVCPACRSAEGPSLCPACVAQLPVFERSCHWCGSPEVKDDGSCRVCLDRGLPHLDRVIVRHPYRGLIKQLVGDAKAAGRPAAVRVLAELMPMLDCELPADAVVVPIPPAHGRRPGPHLATALAQAVARRHQRPFRRALQLTRLAAEQHGLNLSQRQANVEGLFVCRGELNRCVVLVDDLLTSGATASAAAGALREAGAHRVILVCLARSARRPDQRA